MNWSLCGCDAFAERLIAFQATNHFRCATPVHGKADQLASCVTNFPISATPSHFKRCEVVGGLIASLRLCIAVTHLRISLGVEVVARRYLENHARMLSIYYGQ